MSTAAQLREEGLTMASALKQAGHRSWSKAAGKPMAAKFEAALAAAKVAGDTREAALSAWALGEVFWLVKKKQASYEAFVEALSYIQHLPELRALLKSDIWTHFSDNGPLVLPRQLFEKWAIKPWKTRDVTPEDQAAALRIVAELAIAENTQSKLGPTAIVGARAADVRAGTPPHEVDARLAPLWWAIRYHVVETSELAVERFGVAPALAQAIVIAEAARPRQTAFTAAAAAIGGFAIGTLFKHLAAQGADPSSADGNGNTPLNVACMRGESKVVPALLKVGADPSVVDGHGYWPLRIAAVRVATDIKSLVKAGADPDQADEHGRAALSYAVLSEVDRSAHVKALAKVGANLELRDRFGRTPLQQAFGRDRMPFSVPALLKAGADTEVVDDEGKTPLRVCLERLLERRVAYWRSDGFSGDVEIAYEIVNGDFAYLREGHRRPIAFADVRLIAERHCPAHVPFLNAEEWMSVLIRAGADLDAVGPDNRTPRQLLNELAIDRLIPG